MTTKALFQTAFGGAKAPFGPVVEFVRTSGNILTATAHGLLTGAGPYKVKTTNADAPSGITAAVHASLAYTPATDIEDETVSVDGKTYTWRNAPSTDGQVDVNAADATAAENLAAAINLGAGAGTAYGVSMTGNPNVTATAAGAVCTVEAVTLDATVGNAIVTAEAAAGAWAGGATSFAGGVDGADLFIIRLDADTFSVATTKANAVAGTAIALADAGTGVHTLVQAVDTLAESLEDVLLNFLTATGARVLPAADNIVNFWQAAIDGVAVHRS